MERVSDERLEQIANFVLTKDNGFGWTFEELQAIASELVGLREKYAELVVEAFVERASPCDDGWFATDCTTTCCAYGDELVALGLYEKHPNGIGRAQRYRPIKKDTP